LFSFVRFVTEEKVLEIEVELGVADGYQIPFLAEGLLLSNRTFLLFIINIFPSGEPHMEGEPGDLKFVIRIQK
jgi:DnaJ family protein B protein 11